MLKMKIKIKKAFWRCFSDLTPIIAAARRATEVRFHSFLAQF